MSDYKKSFNIICDSNTCDTCPLEKSEDTDKCYHEGFYREGYKQAIKEMLELSYKWRDNHGSFLDFQRVLRAKLEDK